MSTEVRTRAEARLTEAAAALQLADPRGPLRARLKQLREEQPETFGRAVAHYEEVVLPALAEGDDGDAIAVWLEYGRWIGQLSSNGRLAAIDGTGRAAACKPPLPPASLVLFLPEDHAAAAFVAVAPLEPTPAQQATVELLVNRKLAL
jgi:hypothetical protein